MIITNITNIGKIIEFTEGQGQKIKGQGQMCNEVKNWKMWKKSTDR